MNLKRIFEDLKKSRWIWVIYIPVTILIALGLSFTGTCLSPLLTAVVALGIPYLFGVRDVRTFLKVGTLVILITGILFGAIYTYFMYNQMYSFEPRLVNDGPFADGTVTPYLGNENSTFNYTVNYIGSEPLENITVYVNITDWTGKDIKSIPLKNASTLFYNETVLDKNMHYFTFTVHLHDDNTWIETDPNTPGFGPITIPYSDMFTSNIFQGIMILFLNAGLMFYVVTGMYWLSRKSKQEKMKLKEEARLYEEEKEEEEEEKPQKEVKEEEKDEFECTACGATVDADASECPSCGETFEDDYELSAVGETQTKKGNGAKKEKQEVYTCTACGATVDVDATECPSCGESFEDDDEEEKGYELIEE